MALTINPYKTGTVTSISGTTFNATGIVAGDVGRCIRITSGPAIGQIRKIITAGTNTCTVGYAWNISPLASEINAVTGVPFVEVNPVATNTWVMSSYFDDFDDTTNINKLSANVYEQMGTNVITLAANTFVYDRNITFKVNTALMAVTPTACMRFGDIDSLGSVTNGCSIIETANDWSPNRSWTNTANGDAGDLHIYGGLVSSISLQGAGDGIFWSLYRDTTAIYRMIGTRVNGNMGMRYRGDNSVIKNVDFFGGEKTLTWETVNPYGKIGLFKNVNFIDKGRVIYWNHAYGDFFATNLQFKGISNALIYSTDATVQTGTIVGFSADEVEALPAIVNVATASAGSTIFLRNPINTSVIDSNLNVITDEYKRVIWNPSNTVMANETVTDGDWTQYDALWWNYSPSSTGLKVKADGTTTTPYTQSIASYRYVPNSLVVTGRNPSTVSFTGTLDTTLTQTDKTIVNGYTSINNSEKLLDRCKLWEFDNLQLGYPSKGGKLAVGAGNSITITPASLLLDGDAVSVFAVNTGTNEITIRTGAAPVITLVGATEATSSGEVDSITVNFPVGNKNKDVAYLAVGHSQSTENTWNTPVGWVIPTGLTEVATGGTPASTPAVTIFRKVLTGVETSVTVTNAGTNISGVVAQLLVYRGVDNTTPEDVNPVISTGATGDPDPASITTINNDSLVVSFGFMDDGDQTIPVQPSGYTKILDTSTEFGAGTNE